MGKRWIKGGGGVWSPLGPLNRYFAGCCRQFYKMACTTVFMMRLRQLEGKVARDGFLTIPCSEGSRFRILFFCSGRKFAEIGQIYVIRRTLILKLSEYDKFH